MADRADPNAKTIIYVGIVGTVAVFLVVILLQIVFYQTQEMETYRKVVSQAPEELSQLQAQQRGALTGYGWVDEGQGVTRIPIERAMALTVAELGSAAAESGSEAEAGSGAEAGAETEAGAGAETEAGSGAETEAGSGAETEAGSESESASERETEFERESGNPPGGSP